jgi:hypothetical protein
VKNDQKRSSVPPSGKETIMRYPSEDRYSYKQGNRKEQMNMTQATTAASSILTT